MEKRYEGFLAPHGLYILDTFTGDVKFIQHGAEVQTAFSVSNTTSVQSSLPITVSPQTNTYSPFENEVISSYPYLIAKPFADLLEEKDARVKCKLMVDTFTSILKYLALQLASEYLRAKDVKDIHLNQTLTRDLSRPLISVWNLLIARCLPVLRDNNILLFSPEIKEAYEKLESKCKDPFMVSQTYSDEHGELKTRIKKLGKIQALINYRNGLAHGFNQSQTRAQKEFEQYYPLLCDILQEIRFVSRYTLWHVESSRQGVNGIRLMGKSPSKKMVDFLREGVNPAVSPLFLINDASGEILPLYAFFDVDESAEDGLPEIGKDVFVFEGSTKNTLIYLSSSGEHLEKTSRFQHWKELIAQKQFEVEWVNEKNLSVELLHAIGVHISTPGIQALIFSAKYLREATIPRHDLNQLLDAFSYGMYNAFVLGGESGIGKSTLLAQKTEEWQSEGHMVAFYRASSLNQSDIANKFLRDCALKITYLEDFLSLLHPLFVQTDKKCYLIIDALNEYPGNLNELIHSIENTVAQAVNFPWFKIIVSLRDSAYVRTTAKFGSLVPFQYFVNEEENGIEKVSTNIVKLKPVHTDFVEQLYNTYREFKWKEGNDNEMDGYYKYRPLTLYSELDPDGTTVQLIRSPLMARMVMQAFHRKKMPQQLNNDEAMRIYMDNIVIEKTEENTGFPDRKKLLNLLVSEFDKYSMDRIERDLLLQLPVLRTYLFNPQKDSAYIQLLDLGVLMEEWEGDNCFIRFAFDKFFEFLLAEHHWPHINDAVAMNQLLNRAASFKIMEGAIEIILMRFILNHQLNIFFSILGNTNERNSNTDSLVNEIAVRIIMSLCMEKKIEFEQIVGELDNLSYQYNLNILLQLLDKLFATGYLIEFEKILFIAIKRTQHLNDINFIISLNLKSANYHLLKGNYQEAKNKLNSIISEQSEQVDKKMQLTALQKIGVIEWRQSHISEAMEIFKKAIYQSEKYGMDDLSSRLMINLGLLHKHYGHIDDAEKLFYSALEICQQLNDKNGISLSLNNLGSLYKNRGQVVLAENKFQEALLIKHQLGDKKGISVLLNNLGVLFRDQGKFTDAEKYFSDSLKIKRQLDDKKGMSQVLYNLGLLYKAMGNVSDAEKYYLESLQLKRQLNDKKGISLIYNNLGLIYKYQGKMTKAEKCYLASLKMDRAIGDLKGISSSLNNLGLLYDKQGKFSQAEELYLESLRLDNQLGDRRGISSSMNNLGLLYKRQGKFPEAEKLYLDSLEMEIKSQDKKGMSLILNNLGLLYKEQKKYREAEEQFNQSLSINRELMSNNRIIISLNNLGTVYAEQGKIEEAIKAYEESLQIKVKIGHKKGEANSCGKLGLLYQELGKTEMAKKYFLDSLKINEELKDSSGIIGSVHRIYSLMDLKEKKTYYLKFQSMLKVVSGPNQKSLLENIDLMYYCGINNFISVNELRLKYESVLKRFETSALTDLDNSPIEAFYLSILKLKEQKEVEFAKEIAEKALTLIGDRRYFRKEYFHQV